MKNDVPTTAATASAPAEANGFPSGSPSAAAAQAVPGATGNGRAAAAASSRVAVLANPYSGTGPNRRRVERLLETLRGRGLEPRVCWTPAERRSAFEESNDFRCAVVAGGDGSIADAINELERVGRLADTPLAVLPMGNENLFADELGFGKHPGPLAAAIESAASRPIDLGSAGGRLFTLMASAGLDAEVVRRMDRWRTRPTRSSTASTHNGAPDTPQLRRVNRASYALRTLAALRAYPYPRVVLETDDGEITGSHAFVFNLPRYGGGLDIAPEARPDDGLLDFVVFQNPGGLRLLSYAVDVVRGRHLSRGDVIAGRVPRLRIGGESHVPVQADGDAAGATPMEVTARPAAARVLVMPGE